ncbi:hypothetical protein TNIN_408261 [Trichonephila inaurata madagascariensis]|uniref:Uncharacterized protein n=1 Tax=Trichonephila inaurata madagascariensis TaxID=2747483 RepID=A0A8X6XH02_9ARAC|nr:hypothetical protein TNIN_408261 [Trichonephila inaurata madagascariensis]
MNSYDSVTLSGTVCVCVRCSFIPWKQRQLESLSSNDVETGAHLFFPLLFLSPGYGSKQWTASTRKYMLQLAPLLSVGGRDFFLGY